MNYESRIMKILNHSLIINHKSLIFTLASCFILLASAPPALAGPTSTNFQLEEYGFGSGGIATSSSTNFMFQGIAGEIETASLSSTNFRLGPGLTYTLEPNIPAAPSLTNPSNYYNKLKIIIDNGNNSTDTTFVIQISSGSATFSSNVYYVQADSTLGTSLTFQTYTAWGGATGFNIIGLFPGTTYYARVAARRGVFQQGAYSATSNAATINPTLTFDIDTTTQTIPPFSVAIGNLTAGNVTTSSDKITATISTNGTGGALVYLSGTNNGLQSTVAGSYTITSVTNNLTSITEGYGARGTTVTQSSGGPMQLISPYNGAGENVGVIDTTKRLISDSTSLPVTSGQVSFELKAKASNTTPSAGDYTDTLTVIGTGSF